jgi:tetratricopeptide (TPR) repeat protein
MVYTLDHFKTALKNAKDEGKQNIIITIKQHGRDDENNNDDNEDYIDDELNEKTQRRLQKIQKLQNKFRQKNEGKEPKQQQQQHHHQPKQHKRYENNMMDSDSTVDITKAAMNLIMEGKLEEALPLIIKVAQLAPDKVESFINLGNIQRDTGRLEDALVSYRHAFAIEPNNELLITNYQQFQDMEGSAFKSLEVEVDAHSEIYEDHNAGLVHLGKCGGHPVSVSDRVEVRDSDGEWGEGTVESVNKATGAVQVLKDDWDMSYEWEECRILAGASEEGINEENNNVNEQIIWQKSDGTIPSFEGAVIYEPEQLSSIVKYTVQHNDMSKCGSSSFHVIYDNNDDIVLVAIDDFFSDKIINQLRDDALGKTKNFANIEWSWAFVHPAQQDSSDRRKGNGFPGRRSQNLPFSVTSLVRQCLKPIMEQLDDFDFDHTKDDQTLFGLVHEMDGEIGWLDSQRLPHNDVRWDLGTKHNGHVPKSFASVLPLTNDFDESGTGLWYEKSTGDSLLKTVQQNNNAQGAMNPHVKNHLHLDVNLYEEIPDPAIHAVVEHIWAKCFIIAQLRFNRFVLYDGRRLHQQYVNKADERRLSVEPQKGRLTMNSFFWAGP